MTAPPPEGAARVRRGRGPAAASLALAAGLLAGCGADPRPPGWASLALGFRPRTLTQQVAEWERASATPSGTQSEPETFGLGLRRDLAASDWQPSEAPGCFTVGLPAGAFRECGLPARLVGRGREYPAAEAGRELVPGEVRLEGTRLTLRLPAEQNLVPPSLLVLGLAGAAPSEHPLASSAWRVGQSVGAFWIELPKGAELTGPGAPRLFAELVRVEEARALAPFEYRLDPQHLTLCWPGGERPPAMHLALRLENGRSTDGTWQLRIGRFCGNGIPVWSGEREELTRDVPPASRLSFRFVHGGRTRAEPVQARVRLGGELLFERTLAPGSEPLPVSLALPAQGVAGARFEFEVEGAPGLGAFFAPTIGPLELGLPRARPWRARPDLVLFLVDTLRADSLAAYGGEPALAPNLNRFAESCVRFREARSNAAWTLPSISSILTGLHPGQHGATDEDLTLPAFHTTIAEELALAGYRTGAITDGSFFSPVFGLEQGFEWFSQHDPPHWDLDRTIAEARAFLEHDDGRPVFLVVHTYRVHQPYRTGPAEDPSAYDALLARVRLATGTDSPGPAAGRDALLAVEGELRALYGQGVHDLDRGFGAFLAWLEERHFFEHGTLAFTSDHGEALGENHDFFHGGHLWETKLLVPLLLSGPGIAPRALPYRAGPIDLAPTFAALAGLPPDPLWVGSSLIALEHERPAFAFQLGARSRQVACLDGMRKVILTPDGERFASGACEEAFDLASDPQEARNLAASEAWPAELTRRLAPLALGFLEARGEPQRAGVSAELRQQLDALGYGGE